MLTANFSGIRAIPRIGNGLSRHEHGTNSSRSHRLTPAANLGIAPFWRRSFVSTSPGWLAGRQGLSVFQKVNRQIAPLKPSQGWAPLPVTAATSQPPVVSSASTSGCVLLWYRVGDLRVHDHPGLARARERATSLGVPIVPAFVFDPDEARHCRPDFLRLVHESVTDLRSSLRSLGSDLVLRQGPAAEALPALARELGARALVLSESLEWSRSRETNKVLQALGVGGTDASGGAALPSESGFEVIEWSSELRPWVPRATTTAPTAPSSKQASVAAASESKPPSTATHNPVPRNFAAYDALKGEVADPVPTPTVGQLGSVNHMDSATNNSNSDGSQKYAAAPKSGQDIPAIPPAGLIPRGELPELAELVSWAGLPPSDIEIQREKDEEAVRAQDEQLARDRRTKEDAFMTVRDSMAPVLPGQYYKEAVVPPYIPSGGETAALDTLRGYLAFFDATLNPRWQRMYTLIQKKGVGTGFVEAVGPALALGCISPKRVREEAIAYVAASKRTNPLSSVAMRILEERDWQAHVARGDRRAGCQGPGWGLVGLYNVEMGDL